MRILALALPLLVLAANVSPVSAEAPAFTQDPAFLNAHPDMKWRALGVDHYLNGRHGPAVTAFRRAARFADKPSQALLALMLWNGDGTREDRVMAYAWADLAAERGYPAFVATRERFWAELEPEERQAARAAGTRLYAEYGDEVAKRRMEQALLRARRNITGSRTGHVGTLAVSARLPDGGWSSTDGALYYDDRFWKPEQYWQWQDQKWQPRPGEKVEVGPIQAVQDD